jgi:hypothetical protein
VGRGGATAAAADPGRVTPGRSANALGRANTTLRGAAWFSGPDACRAASRDHQYVDELNTGYGVRPVIEVASEAGNIAPYLGPDAPVPATAPAPAPVDAPPAPSVPAVDDTPQVVLVPGAPLRWSYTVTCASETGEVLQPGHDFSYEAAPIIAALKDRAQGIDLVPASAGGATSAAVTIAMHVDEVIYGTKQGGYNTVNASLPVAMRVELSIEALRGCPETTWTVGKSWTAKTTTPDKVGDDQVNQLLRPTAATLTQQIVDAIGREPAWAAKP